LAVVDLAGPLIVSGNGYYPSSPCDPTTLLTPEETEKGMVIACQWYPKGGDMEVEVAIGTEGDCRGHGLVVSKI
jgi:hypothetical protein